LCEALFVASIWVVKTASNFITRHEKLKLVVPKLYHPAATSQHNKDRGLRSRVPACCVANYFMFISVVHCETYFDSSSGLRGHTCVISRPHLH